MDNKLDLVAALCAAGENYLLDLVVTPSREEDPRRTDCQQAVDDQPQPPGGTDPTQTSSRKTISVESDFLGPSLRIRV